MIIARAHLMLAASLGARPADEIVTLVAQDEVDAILSRLGANPSRRDWRRVMTDVRHAVLIKSLAGAKTGPDMESLIRDEARGALIRSVRRRAPEGARVVPVGDSLEIELDGAFGFARFVSLRAA